MTSRAKWSFPVRDCPALCRCSAASLASSHWMPVVSPLPDCDQQNISRRGHMCPGGKTALSGELLQQSSGIQRSAAENWNLCFKTFQDQPTVYILLEEQGAWALSGGPVALCTIAWVCALTKSTLCLFPTCLCWVSEWMNEVAQSCPTLHDPMDCSLPGFSIHGIFQARVLEWVAISFSRRSSQPRDWSWVSRIVGRHFTVWATREVQRVGHILVSIWTWCKGFLGGAVVKNLSANAGGTRDLGSTPRSGRSPGVGNSTPTVLFLPGKFHGQQSLAGYSPWGPKESDMTEQLSTHKHDVETDEIQVLRSSCF